MAASVILVSPHSLCRAILPLMSSGGVTVGWFGGMQDALIARSVLESAGIDCWITNEDLMRIGGEAYPTMEGVHLQVSESDAEVARQLLQPPSETASEAET